ncbi:hypothetical protein HAX54_043726, partial [Datura stramonium]|nr:hypothetical protein [Datura stramonium]
NTQVLDDDKNDGVSHEEDEDNVGDEDEVTNVEEKEEPKEEKQNGVGTHQSKNKIIAPTNKKLSMKIRLSIKKTLQVAPLKK